MHHCNTATYRTRRMYWTLFNVVNERNMITRMPIERVKHRIELNGIDELVNWIDHLQYNEKEEKLLHNDIESIE